MDIWITKDGRHIPMEEMAQDHLANAEKWVERQLLSLRHYLMLDIIALAQLSKEQRDAIDDRFFEQDDVIIEDLMDNLLDRQRMLREERARREKAA